VRRESARTLLRNPEIVHSMIRLNMALQELMGVKIEKIRRQASHASVSILILTSKGLLSDDCMRDK
jgi:hypothetical protein